MANLDNFVLRQLADQDAALDSRFANSASTAGTIGRLPVATNQSLVVASDGSTTPAFDNSSSLSTEGKAVSFSLRLGRSASIDTKVGRA